jgi:hypothetical protein
MFGTLFLLLQSKTMYYVILRTLFCVRRLISLIAGDFNDNDVTVCDLIWLQNLIDLVQVVRIANKWLRKMKISFERKYGACRCNIYLR